MTKFRKSVLTILFVLVLSLPLIGGQVFAKGDSKGRGEDGKFKVARIDEISTDSITVTLGEFKKDKTDQDKTDQDNDENSEEKNLENKNPSEDFVAGDEKVTLTINSDELKEKVKNLQSGNIVFVEYDEGNVLEKIDTIDDKTADKDKKDLPNGERNMFNNEMKGHRNDRDNSNAGFSILNFFRSLLF